MRIVLIGAGNLATNLGKALRKAGQDVCQVYSRTMASASTLAETLNCKATNDINSIITDADAYFFSLKDDALAHVVAQVCQRCQKGVFIHTAGSMPMKVFYGFAAHHGVLYPMQTFSKSREVDFSVIPTFIEYNDSKAERVIKALSSADRRYLHLAAVWACNFVNHCYDISSDILAEHGIPFDVMLPLIDETAQKVHTLSPHETQTGPAVRFDENVINAQALLMDKSLTLQHLYLLLSKSIHESR